jgi:alpha-L-fucosidase
MVTGVSILKLLLLLSIQMTFFVEASDTYWNSTGFLAWLYNESPVKDTVVRPLIPDPLSFRYGDNISFFKVVNDRWGSGVPCHHGGFYTCSDHYNPGHLVTHKWENCFTVCSDIFETSCFILLIQIDKHSWAFRRSATLNDYLTIQELLKQLVTTVRLL